MWQDKKIVYRINGENLCLAAAKEIINKINDRVSKQSKI